MARHRGKAMRPMFLDAPLRWTQAPRHYQSPAQYAEPISRHARTGYPRGWWLIVGFCFVAGVLLVALT